MCGIVGSIFKKDFNKGHEVSVVELNIILDNIKSGKKDIKTFLERCWQYKSNTNFFRYCTEISISIFKSELI